MIDLKAIYNEYNKKYFSSKLPAANVEWAVLQRDRLAEVDLSRKKPRVSISLELFYLNSESIVRLNMLHEQAHILLHSTAASRKHTQRSDHGPQFNAVMLNLAQQGALKGLW